MKGIILSLYLFCLGNLTFAQETIPVDDETKQSFIKEVVDVPGATKAELYDRGLAWMNKFFPNPNAVIQSKNMETGEIIGKAQFKVNSKDKKGTEIFGGIVGFTITLSFKDAKFKYEITRIHWKQPSFYDISRWLDTKDQYYNPNYAVYYKQAVDYFDNVQTELETAVKTPPAKKKDDW